MRCWLCVTGGLLWLGVSSVPRTDPILADERPLSLRNSGRMISGLTVPGPPKTRRTRTSSRSAGGLAGPAGPA